jgi:hypothetical protein
MKQLYHLGQSNGLEIGDSEMQSPAYQKEKARHFGATIAVSSGTSAKINTNTIITAAAITTTTTNNNNNNNCH